MSYIGPVRIVVMKHNPDDSYDGKKGYEVMHVEYFKTGFSCSKTWRRIGDNVDNGDWIREEIQDDYNEVLGDIVKDLPNGFYEIIGDFHHESWKTSYEYDEYDSAWELKNFQYQSIVYEQAYRLIGKDDYEWELTDLLRVHLTHEESIGHYWGDTVVCQFMDRKTILQRFAYALSKLENEYKPVPTYQLSDMNEKQLQDLIHISMMMLSELENEKRTGDEPNRYERSLMMDKHVQCVLRSNRALFDKE